jgi:malate/lactate dehydrogenase
VKVAIAGGGGGVGASVAFNLLLGPDRIDVALLDSRPEMVRSHAWDLEQVLEQDASGTIREGAAEDLAAADVVVVTAAAPLTVNQSRMVYLQDNAKVVADVAAALPRTWAGVLLIVTNPVDPLCTWIQRRTGLDRRRVLGYTLNDSLRLRTGVAKALGRRPGGVEAWTVGEHGEHAVMLWDRISLDGAPVQLTEDQRRETEQFVSGWYVRHVALDSGRSSTWTSGRGVARMVRALAHGDPEPWTASVMLEGEYGISGVSLSVPVSLGPGGVEQIHEWPLTSEQQAALEAGAEFVRTAATELTESEARTAR